MMDIIIKRMETEDEISALYVLEAYQKQGVGRALMQQALSVLTDCRIMSICCCVFLGKAARSSVKLFSNETRNSCPIAPSSARRAIRKEHSHEPTSTA